MDSPRRVAVITGASAGIGKATTRALLTAGWRVIGVGRDPARCIAAEAELREAIVLGGSCDGELDFLRGDFTGMADVRRVAREIAALTDRVDVLINNAGGVRDRMYRTMEGFEATLAANHLAPFVLTRDLMPLLRSTAATAAPGTVRVLAVSSTGHEYCAGMHWDDLNMFDPFTTGGAYCQAKLANLLFTRELDRRVSADGIVAQAMHPGVVASNFFTHGDSTMRTHLDGRDSNPPEVPARTLAWMATAPQAGPPGGRYFHDLAEVAPAPQALDMAAAARLWRETERMLDAAGL